MSKDAAAHYYIEGIKARRPLLSRLFDSALENLERVQAASEGGPAVTQAQWLSQDSGNAFLLINGYALVRFLVAPGMLCKPHSEPRFHDALRLSKPEAYARVPLGRAIHTLAAVARHLHQFQSGDGPKRHNAEVLKALSLDGAHDQAAPQFLQNLRESTRIKDYTAFEAALVELAQDLS